MSDATFLLLFLVPIALIAAFLLFRKKQKKAQQIASTCGEVSHPGGTTNALAWFIGPRLPDWFGGNKSPGMPEHPTARLDGGWIISIPINEAHKVDYITFNHGPMTDKVRIRLRYQVEKEPGVHIYAVPEGSGVYDAQITPYFQREGDDWTGNGKFADYRWYATGYAPNYVQEGIHEMVIELTPDKWTSIQGANPRAFEEAKNNSCCVGFVFGGNDVGYGHGMRASGPAKFTLLSFTVE